MVLHVDFRVQVFEVVYIAAGGDTVGTCLHTGRVLPTLRAVTVGLYRIPVCVIVLHG